MPFVGMALQIVDEPRLDPFRSGRISPPGQTRDPVGRTETDPKKVLSQPVGVLPDNLHCFLPVITVDLPRQGRCDPQTGPGGEDLPLRSEEHTSELQSRPQLVCRLLLEKKKLIATFTRKTATRWSPS